MHVLAGQAQKQLEISLFEIFFSGGKMPSCRKIEFGHPLSIITPRIFTAVTGIVSASPTVRGILAGLILPCFEYNNMTSVFESLYLILFSIPHVLVSSMQAERVENARRWSTPSGVIRNCTYFWSSSAY